MGFFGKLKNFFSFKGWKDDEDIIREQVKLEQEQKELQKAEELTRTDTKIDEISQEAEKPIIIDERKEESEIKQSPLSPKDKLIESNAEKEFKEAKKQIKKIDSYSVVENNIRPEGLEKVAFTPTSSLDEVSPVYTSLIGNKLIDGDDEIKAKILEAAIAGREVMKDRFTLTITIDTSIGQSFDIVFIGVLAEHTEPVLTFFYPDQEIQDPDYDIPVLVERLHAALKQRGSALSSTPSISTYPQQKKWKINNVTTEIDFA